MSVVCAMFVPQHFQTSPSAGVSLTLCILGNLSCFCCGTSTADFFKINLFKKEFRNTIKVSNGLDADQDQHSLADFSVVNPICTNGFFLLV